MAPNISSVGGKLGEMLKETFTNDFRTGYVIVNGVCLPEYYKKFADEIENFEVRDDDVWVCSFPKTGTTWTQEMVWCIANDLDFERGKVLLSERFPFLDFTPLFDYTEIVNRVPGHDLPELVLDSINFVKKLPSPRFIKTHFPLDILPRQIRTGEKKPKIIYVARNAKDTCVSYYYHAKLLEGYRGSFEDFCTLFLNDKLPYAPFWNHVSKFWNRRNDEHMLFLRYENMKTNLKSIIEKTSKFLGKSLTKYETEILMKHLSFQSMKSNPAVNYENVIEFNKELKLIECEGRFMRSGKVDQWKEEMSPEIIKQFDNLSIEIFQKIGISL